MISEQAIVQSLHKGQAVLSIQRESGCQSCELSGTCGTGSLGRLLGFKPKPVSINNDLGLKKGDRVLLKLPETALLYSSMLVYVLPVVSLFVFALLSDLFFAGNDGYNVIAAVLGLGFGLKMASLLSRRVLKNSLQPQVVRQIW